jgi:hypothetical protein
VHLRLEISTQRQTGTTSLSDMVGTLVLVGLSRRLKPRWSWLRCYNVMISSFPELVADRSLCRRLRLHSKILGLEFSSERDNAKKLQHVSRYCRHMFDYSSIS